MKRIWFIGWIKGRWLHLFPWVGLGVVFLCSSITTATPGQGAPTGDWDIGTLDGEHVFGQTFIPEYPQLTAIQVHLRPRSPDHNELVTLRLRRLEAGTPDLAVVVLPVHALAPDRMTTFAFAPLSLELSPRPGTPPLLFILEASSVGPEHGITVVAGPDTYPQGVLLANGEARDGNDLAFQPVYLRRWFDAILPITWLAAGKPGILGWPPLYALLVYVYGYVLVRVFVQAWYIRQQMRGLEEGEAKKEW